MAFISGIQIVHAPASALNNAGADPTSGNENVVAVKALRSGGKSYPYVSAQAYRSWLRRTLEALGDETWPRAPIFREKKVAYTDANPILYADDDLFGYMRAPGKKVEAADSRATMVGDTPTKETVTRISPFRVGTLVAMSDGITRDFGTMSRHEGDPVPHEHQFYRTSLKGMFSLDLASAGVFTYQNKTGFLNLDAERVQLAQQKGLAPDESRKAYRLPDEMRFQRVSALLRAMPVVTGGAKMGLHYTDVSPSLVVFTVMRGGNNPFQYVIDADRQGQPEALMDAFEEVATVWRDQFLSPLYVGWIKGYSAENRNRFEAQLGTLQTAFPQGVVLAHPKQVFEQLADSLAANPDWLA
jgi:CRISPR-associated protein Cst2